MALIFRQASEKDFKECENITREAFWDVYKPGCDEHLVLTKIRKSNCYVRELDLLAIEDEIIIGHIICTKAKVIDARNNEYGVLCVGHFQ
jgi:predicted N-acetyltransferase YhbS